MKKVLVGGCFDLLHYGHIKFLEESKTLGDRLIVALESDENVKRMKGSLRPIHTQEQRRHMLASLKTIDEVIMLGPLKTDQEYFEMVKTIMPDIIAVTEGDPQETNKRRHADAIGAAIVIIPKIHTPSTSQLAKLLGLE